METGGEKKRLKVAVKKEMIVGDNVNLVRSIKRPKVITRSTTKTLPSEKRVHLLTLDFLVL